MGCLRLLARAKPVSSASGGGASAPGGVGRKLVSGLVAVAITIAAFAAANPAAASADPLTWGTPTNVTGEQNNLYALSCPSSSLCLTSDGGGDVFHANPTSGGWTKATIDTSATNTLESLACASPTLCVTGDAGGAVFATSTPTGPATGWHGTALVPAGTGAVYALACDTGPLCLASVSAFPSALYVSTNPTAASPTWTQISGVTIDNGNLQVALACARGSTTDRCFGVDGQGNVTWSTAPTSTQWFSADVDGSNRLYSISCPSISLCVGGDAQGNVVTSVQPTGGAGQWHVHNIMPSSAELQNVSCAADSNGNLCVATDINGDTYDFSVDSTGACDRSAREPPPRLRPASRLVRDHVPVRGQRPEPGRRGKRVAQQWPGRVRSDHRGGDKRADDNADLRGQPGRHEPACADLAP